MPVHLDVMSQSPKEEAQAQSSVTNHDGQLLNSRRRLVIGIVTAAGFLGPIASNIYIPLLPLYEKVFGASPTAMNGTVSAFMFTFGIAPLFWAAFADKYGRRPLYLWSLPFYVISAVLLASLPPNLIALYILRVVQALGASSLVSVGAATISDVVEPKNRGKAISYFLLGPQMGPILGLVLSLVGAGGQWRWTFGILAILSGISLLSILFLLPETLKAHVTATSQSRGYFVPTRSLFTFLLNLTDEKPKESLGKILLTVVTHIPIVWCSVIGGFLFASFYALMVTFASVLKNHYNFTQAQTSIAYLCPGIALIGGSLLTGRVSDLLQIRGTNPDKSPHHPERRLLIQSSGLVICISGLACYGWTVSCHWHCVALFVFAFMISIGLSCVSVVNMTYMTECPTGYISTNVAVGNVTRNLAAGISSLIIEKLCRVMGFGWCFSGLALLNVVSLAMSMVLYKCGAKWNRQKAMGDK